MNAPFAYSSATPVLAWMVSDYVDLTGAQRDFVRERIARAFAWHRAEELPEFRRFLETVLVQTRNDISVDEARSDYRDLRERYHRMLARLVPDLAEFLLQLDPGQVAQLEARLAEDNRKWLRDTTRGTPAERLERRVDRALLHVQEFTGRLDDAQKDLVARHIGSIGDAVPEQLADRRYRNAEVVAIARTKPQRAQAVAALHHLLVETDSWRPSGYMNKIEARGEKLFEMVAELSATLTPAQREHFRHRVRGLMRDISQLTASS